ncbi:hypothetical protein [Loktanella sp. S4079]|nr:hypothetical protein [Loktanella sp. S4079]
MFKDKFLPISFVAVMLSLSGAAVATGQTALSQTPVQIAQCVPLDQCQE